MTTTNSRLFTAGKSPGVFKGLSLGDVHLGHPRTPAEGMLKSLHKYIINDTVLADLDVLFITGDIYDRLLANNDPVNYLIERTLTQLLFKCAKHDVMIRFVEGTPSHDREQGRFLVEQARTVGIDVDIHYASTLSIEYIEKFDIHVLYVPDKWRHTTEETLLEVKALMADRGITKVAFAVMHGAFEYQLPDIVTEPAHDSATYLALVEYFIMIGHVHRMTEYERILAAGSFDRDGHGNEEAKGFFVFNIFKNKDYQVQFIENKDAKKYIEIDCTSLESREAFIRIDKDVKLLPQGSAVKIKCHATDPIAADFKTLLEYYPDLELSLGKHKDEKQTAKMMEDVLTMDLEVFAPITPQSMPDLLMEEVNKLTQDAAQRSRCSDIIKSLVSS